MLLAVWKLVFIYRCLKCSIFQHPFAKEAMRSFRSKPTSFATFCFLIGLFVNLSDDGGKGKSSVPALVLLFAYTSSVKWCSPHTKVPLTCTLSGSHKCLQNKHWGKSPSFFHCFQTHICLILSNILTGGFKVKEA